MAKIEESAKSDAQIVHGITLACYAGGSGEPYFQPYMECSCGFSTGRQGCWRDAGEAMDRHLAAVGL